MKRLQKVICSVIVCLVILLTGTGFSRSSYSAYSDVKGHWAESAIRQAYEDGLIDGYDGRLFPDEDMTAAQALTILCRAFGAEAKADISTSNVPANKWYYDYAAKSVYIGLIPSADTVYLEAPVSRQDAFFMLAEAFQLIETTPDMTVLKQFSDSGRIASEKRRAIASLVSQGVIGGYNGILDVDGKTTRATFLSVFYRIVRKLDTSSNVGGHYDRGVLLHGSVKLSGNSFGKGVWFDCAASDVSLVNVTADRAIVRSNTLDSLKFGGSTHIGRLTLAAQTGDITAEPEGGAAIDTLIIGSGAGMVSIKGVSAIEVAGDNRRVTVTDSVRSIVVSGRGCTIQVQEGARVARFEMTAGAYGSNVVMNGTVDEMAVRSLGTAISGDGNVGILRLFRGDTKISVSFSRATDNADIGLEGASVRINAPANLVAGSTLRATATIANVVAGKACRLTWYIDSVPAMIATITTGETIPELTHNFDYNRVMQENADIKVKIEYMDSQGERHEISAEKTIKLQNYSKKHWMAIDAPDVLKKVTTGYKGDFTQAWAEAHDLDDYDKEVWIYAKGYTSASDYLLWINITYQRVNIFKRVDGRWDLIRTCVVGTGRPGRDTPVGVWTTSYKQSEGWTTPGYTVKPVVRFMGSIGYAFHSRLYRPGTTTIGDPSIGFPVSNGCVRMYEEDIDFIYKNIPDGTTVVVY